jgi:hypothetical protein
MAIANAARVRRVSIWRESCQPMQRREQASKRPASETNAVGKRM